MYATTAQLNCILMYISSNGKQSRGVGKYVGTEWEDAFEVKLFARRPEFESLILIKKSRVATGSCDPNAGRDKAESEEITGLPGLPV